jgi:hypothetical protein
MALFKYSQFFTQTQHANFDKLHPPGASVPDSGIYRCEGCGKEISHTENNILPPQNHHQHTYSQGDIRWRLTAAAQTK